MPEHLQDTLRYTLIRKQEITTEKVGVSATITGLIHAGRSESQMRDELRAIVERFIPNVEWKMANMNRSVLASGREQFSMTAYCRAPISEYHGLDQRRIAATANVEDIRITGHHVDTSPHIEDQQQVEQALRLAILAEATKQADEISAASERSYRVGNIDFRTSGALPQSQVYTASLQMGSANMMESPEIGNTTEVIMTAQVELRTPSDEVAE